MIAGSDHELVDWIYGVLDPRSGAGGFLRALCEAVARADDDNYAILRPSLLLFKAKYPKYRFGQLPDVQPTGSPTTAP